MNIWIIEDEQPAFRRLKLLLNDLLPEANLEGPIQSVEDAVTWFSTKKQPDLVFLDIQLADGISFSIFDKMELLCPVIFVTAYDEYMLDAFRLNSVDYLLKPIRLNDLKKALEKDRKLRERSNNDNVGINELIRSIGQLEHNKTSFKERFLVRLGTRMEVIETKDIAYLKSEDKMVILTDMKGRSFPMDQSLDQYTHCLSPKLFFRVNRQFLIHLQIIHSIEQEGSGKLFVNLKTLQVNAPKLEFLNVSKEKATAFKKWLQGEET